MLRQAKKHFPLLLYLLFYLAIFSRLLISRPLPFYDWDESIYAQVGREMVQTGTWYVPLWRGEVWLDKPPLVPLVYGLIIKLTPFIQAEISTRLVTLFVAVIALGMVYALFYKAVKDRWLPLLAAIITSWTPIILQRALVLNIDIFLLVGWLGYLLFYHKRSYRVAFLFLAVMSKSLIGFYAPAMMLAFYTFEWSRGELSKRKWMHEVKQIAVDCAMMSLWYAAMLALFGKLFWVQHIYESHFRRVTASIESHFGKRTFYIDLLFETYGAYIWLSVLGLGTIVWMWLKKHLTNIQLLYALYLLPWFLFLNLTKTKIFWYSHPYIPQFAFLMTAGLLFLKRMNKRVYLLILLTVASAVVYRALVVNKLQYSAYSSFDAPYKMAVFARSNCQTLGVYMSQSEREKITTLKKLGLTITTTTWWGDHPAMVYYFGKRVEYIYSLEELSRYLSTKAPQTCIIISEQDLTSTHKPANFRFIKKSDTLFMYKSEYPL